MRRKFENFGKALRYWRRDLEWSQDEAAKKLVGAKLSGPQLCKLETGKRWMVNGRETRVRAPEVFPTVFNWALILGLESDDACEFLRLALVDRHGEGAFGKEYVERLFPAGAGNPKSCAATEVSNETLGG